MKPSKNHVFCPSAQRPKMLFRDRCKALNFIRFNYNEIMEESGRAPDRTYYCHACGGWHVTSKKLPLSNIKKMKEMLDIAILLLKNGMMIHCMRFILYAQKYRDKSTKIDKKTNTEYLRRLNCLAQEASRRFIQLLNAPNLSQREKPAFNPMLLHKHNSTFVYAINRGSLSAEAINSLPLRDGDIVRNLTLHRLNIVDIINNIESNGFNRNSYSNVEDMFEGEIYGYWIQGRKLFVLAGSSKKSNSRYLKSGHLSYRITMGDRVVRFFAGSRTRYACLFSQHLNGQHEIEAILQNEEST